MDTRSEKWINENVYILLPLRTTKLLVLETWKTLAQQSCAEKQVFYTF